MLIFSSRFVSFKQDDQYQVSPLASYFLIRFNIPCWMTLVTLKKEMCNRQLTIVEAPKQQLRIIFATSNDCNTLLRPSVDFTDTEEGRRRVFKKHFAYYCKSQETFWMVAYPWSIPLLFSLGDWTFYKALLKKHLNSGFIDGEVG